MQNCSMKERIQRHIHDIRTYQKEGKQVPLSDMEFHTCPSCGHDFFGKFCPHCGENGNAKRFTLKTTFIESFISIARLDNALMRTITDLCVRPGHMINDYLHGRRRMYVTPVKIFIILFIILGFVHYLLYNEIFTTNIHIDVEEYNKFKDLLFSSFGPTISHHLNTISNWIENQPYTEVIYQLPFEILAFKLVFSKSKFRDSVNTPNWSESFITLVYIHSVRTIIIILSYFVCLRNYIIAPIICAFCIIIHQLFGFSWKKSIWKTISFVTVAFLIATFYIAIIIMLMHFL